jgi:hypothetical protein
VCCVPVPVVNVVGVVLVRHSHVTALRAVLMGMALMRHVPALYAFVRVIAVDPVNVSVVRVIGVIAVRERNVSTALTVGMAVIGVSGVLSGIRHRADPSCASSLIRTLTYSDVCIYGQAGPDASRPGFPRRDGW